jgi:hypothetical protein
MRINRQRVAREVQLPVIFEVRCKISRSKIALFPGSGI